MTKAMEYKGFEGAIYTDDTRSTFWGRILWIDDVITYQARTPADLQREFEAAVDDYIETCAQVGKELNGQARS